MPDFLVPVGSLLSALWTLPAWALGGLALAGYAVIFASPVGGIGLAWAWIWALTFSALTFARFLDLGVKAYRRRRQAKEAQRILRLVPLDHPRPLRRSWWHLAKQQDGSLVSQISIDIAVTNLSDCPVLITKCCLARPKPRGEPLQADVMLPMAGNRYWSSERPILPRTTVEARLHMLVPGALTSRESQSGRRSVSPTSSAMSTGSKS